VYIAFDINRLLSFSGFVAFFVLVICSPFLCAADPLPAVTEKKILQIDPESPNTQAESKKIFNEKISPFLKNYCTDCHGDKKQKGGFTFRAALKNPGSGTFNKEWKKSVAIVKAHDMPPEDAPKQPSEEERQQFAEWVSSIKFLSPKDPGTFVIRRLTKTEYGNTLRDLLGVDPAVAGELPDEVSGAGYLNTLSPLLLEQYLAIANEMLARLFPAGQPAAAANQTRLFGAVPPDGADARPHTLNALRSLARRAYRRPPTEAELGVLMEVYDLAAAGGRSYPEAMRLVLKGILVSPQFLFITPAPENVGGAKGDEGRQTNPAAAAPEVLPLDDHQLASRLSYLLWATMPDAQLSSLADAGRLREPSVLKAETARLLKDPRSRALFDGFGVQWLGLGKLEGKTFDPKRFPQMNTELRTAMHEEVRLFFESVVRENRSILSFIDSDYTFLNGPLATLYGLEKSVSGPTMRRVSLTDRNRGGILGMPGILAATSFPNRTSPVNRGVWVLEQLLGEHVPPPPPNVPALEKQDKTKVANMTMRQRTELHRTNPVCANCHKILDPIGFGLENFDAIGRWRDSDEAGGPIDATGELPGGKTFSSPMELKAILAARSADLCRNLSEKFLAYALCRQLEGYDEIVAEQIAGAVARDGFRMQGLIAEVIASYPFTHRRVQEPTTPTNEKKMAN
jgi:hypothetical protein